MKVDLFEFEAVEDAPGGPEPAPEPAPSPEPEPAPEPFPEPEAWAGPTREEWEQTQARLAQADELVQSLQYQTPRPEAAEPEPEPVPEFDMFDPEGVRAHDEWLLGQIDQRLSRATAPISEHFANQQAEEWAENTFSTLGVPEADHWRNGVLFASAGFQQFDDQGRALVHPTQAAKQGYEFLKGFAEAERQAAVEEYKKTQEAESAALRERAGAPDLPSGSPGVEGAKEYRSLEEATRDWLARERAANAAG